MTIPEPYTLHTYGPTIIGVLLVIALTRHPAATP